MVIEGLIVNGRVETATALPFPEGTKVFVGMTDCEPLLPFEVHDRNTVLAMVNEAMDDLKNGRNWEPFDDAMMTISKKHKLPLAGED